jgi:hypothetical protein
MRCESCLANRTISITKQVENKNVSIGKLAADSTQDLGHLVNAYS